MRIVRGLVLATAALAIAVPAAAQETAGPISCRDRPCDLLFDWTREGGLASQVPDRRYGNPAQLEDLTRAALTQRGYTLLAGADAGGLRIILQPAVNQAMCDQMAGTSTDMSCQAITEIQARVEGPDAVTDGVDLPSRLRNRCGADRLMTVDQFAVHVAEYIAYAVEGKAKGDRRPVGRC